jgi:hypothetical protein
VSDADGNEWGKYLARPQSRGLTAGQLSLAPRMHYAWIRFEKHRSTVGRGHAGMGTDDAVANGAGGATGRRRARTRPYCAVTLPGNAMGDIQVAGTARATATASRCTSRRRRRARATPDALSDSLPTPVARAVTLSAEPP